MGFNPQKMKGGNGVREANVVTLCSKCEIPYYATENLLLDVGKSLYLQLDGDAVKKCGSLQKS